MFCSRVTKISDFWKVISNIARCYCEKSLVLKKNPKKKSLYRLSLEAAVKKKITKKKFKIISKTPSDYCEDIWLDNINKQNLKLYRKTSFGSFRKINISKLLERFKDINLLGLNTQIKNISSNLNKKICDSYNNKNGTELAPPQMSGFLIENMLSFPLLKSEVPSKLSPAFKEEREDYGVVDSIKFPSVTAILQETMSEASKQRLEKWKEDMILKLGSDGFKNYSQDPESILDSNQSVHNVIETRRNRKQLLVDSLKQGSKFHNCLKTYLEAKKKSDVVVDNDIKGCWDSLNGVLKDINDIKMTEESVHHPILMYKGVLDCVASYRNTPCVIEWKKSDKLKTELSATNDAPLQLCAYLGALSWQKFRTPLTSGLVVIAYSSGTPASAFMMDLECCEFYWSQWLRRLQTYWINKSSVLIEKKEAEI